MSRFRYFPRTDIILYISASDTIILIFRHTHRRIISLFLAKPAIFVPSRAELAAARREIRYAAIMGVASRSRKMMLTPPRLQ